MDFCRAERQNAVISDLWKFYMFQPHKAVNQALYFKPVVDAFSSVQLLVYLKLSSYLSAVLYKAILGEPRAEHSTVLLLLNYSGCFITAITYLFIKRIEQFKCIQSFALKL